MHDHPNSRILTWHFVLPFSSPFLDSPPRSLHHACSSVYLCISWPCSLLAYLSFPFSLSFPHDRLSIWPSVSRPHTPFIMLTLLSIYASLGLVLGIPFPSLHTHRLLFLSRSLFLSFLCLPSRCLHFFPSSLRLRFSLYPHFLPVYIPSLYLFLFNPSHANLIFPSFLSPIFIHLYYSYPVSVSLSASLSYLPLFSIFIPLVLFDVLSILLFFVIHLLFTPPPPRIRAAIIGLHLCQ